MRLRLLVLAAALGSGACQPAGCGADPQPAFDLLITNARIVDGTGAAARPGAVAVRDGRIAAIGDVQGEATLEIDAAGHVVAPGFIDLHSHSDMPLVTDGHAESKIRQGVTTEVIGESGSVAPRAEATAAAPWTDFAGYYAVLERQGIAVNLLSYIGLGTVRELEVGGENRPATEAEIAAMAGRVQAALDQGVFGVSTGLLYPPNAFASLEELVALTRPAGAAGGLHASHVRYDGAKLRDGLEEVIAIGERAATPIHLFHLKVTGQPNFGRMNEVIEIVEAARARGLRVTADQYPYVASSTSLTATIPDWAEAGGTASLVARLKDPATRARIRRDMEDPNPTWENRYQSAGSWQNIQLAAIGRTRGSAGDPPSPNRQYEGMRIAEAAARAGKDPFDFAFDLLIEEEGAVGCVYFIMSEDDLTLALRQPWVAIGSDGSALAVEGPLRAGVPHPRSFGTFPRVLGRYVREQQALTLEEAVRKMTSLPAEILGLSDRGTLAEGRAADLVVFDPATVIDRATFEDPFQYPDGIRTVVVNGEVVLNEGQHTGARPGRVLRRAGAR